ncbi:hypothetical protein GSI_03119 [Ganoderma sinense ZZ0214-1]|uniref:F-box domain-containing protein n=1 Tax=Ganoderma sinense ZZ0214-1 TaxID=1077348 RepID=A0A2G8SKQ3_9APHY|nr:hypothetical protein GSI_03119 [Ganoderma sinense ZZ0214-1]
MSTFDSLAVVVDARLAKYSELAERFSAEAGYRSDPDSEVLIKAFAKASEYIPASLTPPPLQGTRRQTKIPQFFHGWKSKFPNLPLDVLLEITSDLHPRDLLNLSRTSKVFRSALLSRGSRAVWMNVLCSLPDFPSCPEDMSEPAYIALVFDDHCFSCATTKAYCVDYVLRIRLCDQCWDKYVIPGTDLLDDLDLPDIVCDVITMLVPAFDYDCSAVDEGKSWAHHLHPVSHVPQDLYYQPELEKMIGFCWPPPSPMDLAALRPALLRRVEYIIQRHIHGVQMYWWLRLATTSLSSYAKELARNRATVMQDIHEQKYLLPYAPDSDSEDEDLEQNRHYDPNIYTLGGLIRTCGVVTISQDQYDNERSFREDCDNAVRDACFAARLTEVGDWYEHLVAHHAAADLDRRTLPNRHDGGRVFNSLAWENESRVRVDERTFYDRVGPDRDARALLQPRIQHTMHELAALVPFDWRILAGVTKDPDLESGSALAVDADSIGGLEDETELALERLDTLFVCRECGARGLPWPEIHGHWREQHPDTSFWCRKTAGSRGKQPKVRLWADGREVVRAILDEAGLTKDLGRTRLDKLVRTGQLYCACGDPGMALRGDLDWVKFVHHVWAHREAHRARCLA